MPCSVSKQYILSWVTNYMKFIIISWIVINCFLFINNHSSNDYRRHLLPKCWTTIIRYLKIIKYWQTTCAWLRSIWTPYLISKLLLCNESDLLISLLWCKKSFKRRKPPSNFPQLLMNCLKQSTFQFPINKYSIWTTPFTQYFPFYLSLTTEGNSVSFLSLLWSFM